MSSREKEKSLPILQAHGITGKPGTALILLQGKTFELMLYLQENITIPAT